MARYLIKGRTKKDNRWENVSMTINDDNVDRAVERFCARMLRVSYPGDTVIVDGVYLQLRGRDKNNKEWRTDEWRSQ